MWGHRYTSDDERALIGARHGDPEGVQVLLRRVVVNAAAPIFGSRAV